MGQPALTLTRPELTAALADRQLLAERRRLNPAEAIGRLTPLQGQHPPAPYLALAARLEGFVRSDLEAALARRAVVKTTIMRQTLHLAAAADYPAYAQLARQARMRSWRKRHPDIEESRVCAELRVWLAEPRGNGEIRERVAERWPELPRDPHTPVGFVRDFVPLVQVPPAGYWGERRRAQFVVDPRPLPGVDAAAELVLRRYLAAFGPASLRDAAAWAGVAQRDFAAAAARLPLIRHRDERGSELLDLRSLSLPPASTPLPVRLLANWDQPLLAYAERERIIPPELAPLGLTLSGDPIVTVDGRVAARWSHTREGDVCRLRVEPLVGLSRAQKAAVRAEAKRTAHICAAPGDRIEVALKAGD